MKQTALFLFALLSTGSALAAGCFTEHLDEAMALNHARKPLYAALTAGASVTISDDLIGMERNMSFYGRWLAPYEKWAAPFEAAGIRIICDSYVPMNTAPAFSSRYAQGAPRAESAPSASDAVNTLAFLPRVLRNDFAGVKALALEQIEAAGDPRLNCLSRHFLESIGRIAALAPVHAAQARRAGLSDPTWIHRRMILGHLSYTNRAVRLDAAARPLQLQGVPILCQDIPAIPIP